MLVFQIGDRILEVEPLSVLLNAVAFTCVLASFQDGYQPLFLAASLWIYDTIRFPYDAVLDITDLDEDGGDDGDGDLPAT